ncbi:MULTISPECIES: DUF1822 family protein [Moorena]|uniref:DUF1822 family protein n=1 Tax=Moorena producens 3L TaxID=489825 RepID=F4XJT9_9CYAN|nr:MULTISPECIES: DUF1822 family protein [Moorena]EGJ35369.1 protein of unknown function, DUF1822 [Moorena producens 3L]NEP63980.1 DUF1822 family protein [Moorena sp. SIO3A5]NES44998.1 DUF1822 family protein [Moorena sp. SIO2C4]OLT65603.1 hypothetical protein BI334_11680 [Moorena producens 3L]
MNNLTEKLTFSVPLTRDWYQLAETFSREQHEPDKAQDVYLNTLAVYAVNFYLQCMEVETDLPASDSSNPALRSLMNVSDLMVKGWGKLECRPVLPGDLVCDIPPESRQDRVGYVVVEIHKPSNQAKLLGFSKTAVEGSLDISKIESLEQLINQLPELESKVVKLLEWLKDNFELVRRQSKFIYHLEKLIHKYPEYAEILEFVIERMKKKKQVQILGFIQMLNNKD